MAEQNADWHSNLNNYDYDLIVIGGGSGGMAAAKEASKLGAEKVLILNHVKPTQHGTKWGFGGTCVAVGCIPKKLMHYASTLGDSIDDAHSLGWERSGRDEKEGFNFRKMAETVQNHVKKLSFQYLAGIRKAGIAHMNAQAVRIDSNHKVTAHLNGDENEVKEVSGEKIIIATGGRPTIPESVPGAVQNSITSDDLFWLKESPGKTLVVGGSYIAMECAGALNGIGLDVTVAVRSVALKQFDRDCADHVVRLMQNLGTRFRFGVSAASVAVTGEGRLVTFSDGSCERFETVMFAVGRSPCTGDIDFADSGVGLDEEGKIRGEGTLMGACEGAQGVYAVGDVLKGAPELTPIAIRQGELVARHLFGQGGRGGEANGGAEERWSPKWEDLRRVPTTVFTPYELASVGMTEEEAARGEGRIRAYKWEWKRLEVEACHRRRVGRLVTKEEEEMCDDELPNTNMCKVICNEEEEVLGMQYVGMEAGEIINGFSVALNRGICKRDLDATVGVHPTDSEAVLSITTLKGGEEPCVAQGGCGGGKCG